MKTRELEFPDHLNIGFGSIGANTKRTQEWLTLNGIRTSVDGDFGPATRAAVCKFQARNKLTETGRVDRDLFTLLTLPMQYALQPFFLAKGAALGDGVVEAARAHLNQKAREVGGDNRGPWVRYYCGADGASYLWCAGFACRIVRQAADTMGIPCPVDMTLSCDMLAKQAKEKGRFISGYDKSLKPGDIGLVRSASNPNDWIHAFIVTRPDRDHAFTIEGNSNDEGSRNGYEVCERVRGYKQLDFFSV